MALSPALFEDWTSFSLWLHDVERQYQPDGGEDDTLAVVADAKAAIERMIDISSDELTGAYDEDDSWPSEFGMAETTAQHLATRARARVIEEFPEAPSVPGL